MKKTAIALILLAAVLFIFFKLKPPRQEDYLVRINNYTITPEEFYDEFKDSAYAKNNTPESKREFLNMLIRRKLVLQDAQASGLDKDPEFLKDIERFWEQSLLKLAMEKKTREFSGNKEIPDAAIKLVYEKLKTQGKADRSYEQMYNEIKWSLSQFQESQAVNKWLIGLYNKSKIEINPAYVKKEDKPAGGQAKDDKKTLSQNNAISPKPAAGVKK